MKKFFFIIIGILSAECGLSQISVYDCDAFNNTVTQAEIDAISYEYYKQCISFDAGNYLFNGASNKKVTASTQIALKPGFHAGAYTNTGGMHLNILPKSDFDVFVMEYDDLDNVMRYEKLELGVELPDEIEQKVNNFLNNSIVPSNQKLNPFLEWKVKIQGVFIHSSGMQKTVEGFYYREMQRDLQNNEWDDLGTSYPFRIRFAPPQNGKWTCQVKIFINEQLDYSSTPFNFNVKESGNKGYVKVHPNKKNLMHGNEIIFPVGINLPHPYNNSETYYSANIPISQEGVAKWINYANDIKNYGNQGGKYVRMIISQMNSDIEFEHLGNYYDRLNYASEIDGVIKTCEDKNMLIEFNMMLQSGIMLKSDYGDAWDFANLPDYCDSDKLNSPTYCYGPAFGASKMSEVINNENAMDYMKQRYRYMISRWGYSTAIYMFELLSEPWHMDEINGVVPRPYEQNNSVGETTRKAVQKFHADISSYIKNNMSHVEHLIAANGMFS